MRIIKILAKALAVLVIASFGFYFFWLSPRYTVPILTYHSFGDEKGLMSVTAGVFEKQMLFLKQGHYNVIPFSELIDGISNNRKFPHNSVVLTIDDGYKDNYTIAYPILKKYGFPAIIFIATNRIGNDPDYLTWNEIKEMSGNRIAFGSHTKNHSYLPSITDQAVLWDEIAGSKKAIEAATGIPVDFFCYPIGGFTKEIVLMVIKAGYKGACATNRSVDIPNKRSTFGLARISIRNDDSPEVTFKNLNKTIAFRAKLAGFYNAFRKSKRGY